MHPIEKKINDWLDKLSLSPDELSSRNRENIKLIRLVLTRLLVKSPPSPEPCNCRINRTFVVSFAPDGTPHEMYCNKIHPKEVT